MPDGGRGGKPSINTVSTARTENRAADLQTDIIKNCNIVRQTGCYTGDGRGAPTGVLYYCRNLHIRSLMYITERLMSPPQILQISMNGGCDGVADSRRLDYQPCRPGDQRTTSCMADDWSHVPLVGERGLSRVGGNFRIISSETGFAT